MNIDVPFLTEAGWYVELPGPAETVLTRKYKSIDKAVQKAADAQAWLYCLNREKLKNALESLHHKYGMWMLARALSAEDALRWNELLQALELFQSLTKLREGDISSPEGALSSVEPSTSNESSRFGYSAEMVAAWARLREIEVMERMGHPMEAQLKLNAASVMNSSVETTGGELEMLRATVTARLLFRRGDPAGALRILEQTTPADVGPSPVHGAWLRGKAIYSGLSGRSDRSLGQHKLALDCFKALGDRYNLIKQYTSLAQTFLEGGELDHADLYADKAADALGSLEHPHLQALVKSRAGMIALLRGDLNRARTLFGEDLVLCRKADLRPAKFYAKRNLGKVLIRLGLRREGAEHLAASQKGFQDFGDPVNERLSRTEEIAARLSDGAPEELMKWLKELENMATFFAKRNRPTLEVLIDMVRARIVVKQGKLPQARALIDQVIEALRRQRRGDRLVEFLTAVAAAYPREYRDEAEALLRLAYREAENSGRYWAARLVLKSLDEYSEVAALDLAREPRIPTGLDLDKVNAASVGFFEQSRSEPFRKLMEEARSVAQSDITVLLQGETGVGKDWLARYLHSKGPRAEQVYRGYNCGAVTETLLEAELFGYEKGAFTGADKSKMGIFEAAEGGTVLLDEVGELSSRAQAALLRVLDQRVVQPVGSTQPRAVDVRILAATNRDLAEAVADGHFRSDLYYRLAVYTLRIPPLRERPEDIPLLTQHLLERTGDAMRRQIKGVDKKALNALIRYPWPGNLRELSNVLHSAVIRCAGKGRTIRCKHLPRHIMESTAHGHTATKRFTTLAEMEKEHIQDALHRVRGNQSEAAKLLGIHRNTLANKMRKYSIES